jgi:hypothetical protein
MKAGGKQNLEAGFFSVLIFNLEDGGYVFLRNVS